MIKHAHVAATLTAGEIAPWAALPLAAFEPVEKPARTLLAWEGETWAEIDPQTGHIIATGTVGSDDCRSRAVRA